MVDKAKYHYFIGIDPGITGAIAVLDSEGKVALFDMPVRVRGGKVSKEVSALKLGEILREFVGEKEAEGRKAIICVERVASRPDQGVAGMFSLGDSYGVVRGCVGGLGGFCVDVIPVVWRKGVGLKAGTGKEGSLAGARALFGREGLERKKDNGRADALLIAEYARRRWG